jgi:Leucine-rich repeat (LRR) protein
LTKQTLTHRGSILPVLVLIQLLQLPTSLQQQQNTLTHTHKYRQNKLTEVPEAIESLTELRVLSLSSNRLAALPQAIAKLHRYVPTYLRTFV